MNKEFFKTFFSAGIPFGIVMGLLFGIVNGLYYGIASGIFVGIIFGIGISSFVQIQRKEFNKASAYITKGKTVIMDGGANHFISKEAVGGWLYLTAEELIFKSHAFNIQNHQTIISLEQVTKLKIVTNLGFIKNGLQITMNNGTIEKFVVSNPKNWIENIDNTIFSLNF